MVKKPKTRQDDDERKGPKWDEFGNTRTTLILDKETYYLVKGATIRTFGRPNLAGGIRQAARAWAMNVLGTGWVQQIEFLRIQDEGEARPAV